MPLPRVALMLALKSHLAAAVAALPPGDSFLVRHHRHRESTAEEWPCLAIKFVSDDTTGITTGTDDDGLSMAETVMDLSVDLIADVDLEPERDAGEPADPDEDPTGLAGPSRLIKVCLDSLLVAGEPADKLGGLAWDIRHEGTGNDEESSPDAARMVERIVLVYRVRADAPTELLLND